MILPKQSLGRPGFRRAGITGGGILAQQCSVHMIERCAPLIVECERACASGYDDACATCYSRLSECAACFPHLAGD